MMDLSDCFRPKEDLAPEFQEKKYIFHFASEVSRLQVLEAFFIFFSSFNFSYIRFILEEYAKMQTQNRSNFVVQIWEKKETCLFKWA